MLPYRKHWRSRKVNRPFGVYSRTTINIATGRLLKNFPRGSSRPERRSMQEYKEWTGNIMPDASSTIQHVRVGDIIKIKENDEDRIGRASKYHEYEIVAIYPWAVLTVDNKTGFRRCFSFGDLMTMGLEHQNPEIEDMRKSYEKDQRKESISMTRSSFNPDYDPENYRKKRKKKNEDSGEENPAEVLPGSEG